MPKSELSGRLVVAAHEVKSIVLVDTSILLNVLRVPSKSGDRDTVMAELEKHIRADNQLFLPMATVVETGNHIAQIKQNGTQRRRCAKALLEVVRMARDDDVPWTLVDLPDQDRLMAWLDRFPDQAMRGVALGDVSIIDEWYRACQRHSGWRVAIWSLDTHMQGYEQGPSV